MTNTIPASVIVPRFAFPVKFAKEITVAVGKLAWAKDPKNCMEVTLGRRYLELKAKAYHMSHDTEEPSNDDSPFSGLRSHWFSEDGSLPTKDELAEELVNAQQEVIDARALGIEVDHHIPNLNRWSKRAPKIGDIVTVPRDLWIDKESNGEPEEERGNSGSVWEDLMKPLPQGVVKPRDMVHVQLTLAEMLDPKNDRDLALVADKLGKGRVTTALTIMQRYGRLTAGPVVKGKMWPTVPTDKGIFVATQNLALSMMKNGRRPSEKYWLLWAMQVSVHFEIPALEFIDNGDKASEWSLSAE